MVVIAKNPRAYSLPNSGKSLDHIAWYGVGRGPVTTKSVMDLVACDGSIYRWSRHHDDEPWTYECRVRADESRDTAKRSLPRTVETLVGRSPSVLYA